MSWLPKNALSKCVTASLLVGCAVNPVTGQREIAFVSTEQEIALGQEQFAEMQQAEGGAYTHIPEVSAYVSHVGHKLAAVSDRPDLPYEFVVLDNETPNAWTLPGGKIAINRGLLKELHSEAELAAVLSHEIVHAAARHGAQNLERGMLALGGLLGAEGALGDNPHKDILIGASAVGTQLAMLRYSRKAELEADRYGMTYMSRAGYDPRAAIKLQKIFLKLAEEKNPHWLEGLFQTHPPTQERLEANRQTASTLPKGGFVGSDEYRNMLRLLKS